MPRIADFQSPDWSASDRQDSDAIGLTCELLFYGKWKLQILSIMCSGPVRFGQLTRLVPNASKKMLAQNLRKLEADGIVMRTDLSGVILHVEYALNPKFQTTVCELFDQLREWGDGYARWSTLNANRPEKPRNVSAESPAGGKIKV